MYDSVMVIGRVACETSRGPLAVGEYCRLPIAEAAHLNNLERVKFADYHEQDLPDPQPRSRYRRRDLRADE